MPTVDLDPAWSSNSGTNSITSASFSPNAASLIVVDSIADSNPTGITASIADNTGGSLTWTAIGTVQVGTSGGAVHSWWAYTSGALTGTTATVTWAGTGTTQTKAIKVTTYTSTASVSAVISQAQAASATNNLTVNITTTNAGCRVAGAAIDWNALGAPTSTDTITAFHSAGAISGAAVRKSADSGSAGSSVGLNFDAFGSSAPDWGYKVYEIVPAAGGGSSVSYVPPRTPRSSDPGESYWIQRDRRDANLVGTPANPLSPPLDSAWQAGGRYWHVANDWRRTAWQPAQRTSPDPALLAAPATSVPFQPPRPPAQRDSGEVPWQQPRRADLSLLATAELENELLGGGDTARHYLTAATHAARPSLPQQRAALAAPDDVQIVGTGATGGWWSVDDTASYLGQRRASDPSLLAPPAGPFDPTLGAWLPLLLAWNRAATHGDRREVPQQRAYISDPSFYPTVPPTDPLTLAWGAGGTYWMLYNRAATHVDRRKVPQQHAYVSDPGLLATALLEDALLGGWGDRLRHYLVAAYADRRQMPQQRTPALTSLPDADPLLLAGAVGGDLWRRYTLPAYGDRREVPQQPQREWLYSDAGPGLPPLTLAWGAGGAYWHLYNRPSRSRWSWPLPPQTFSFGAAAPTFTSPSPELYTSSYAPDLITETHDRELEA